MSMTTHKIEIITILPPTSYYGSPKPANFWSKNIQDDYTHFRMIKNGNYNCREHIHENYARALLESGQAEGDNAKKALGII